MYLSKVSAVVVDVLAFQAHGNAQSFIHAAHIVRRDASGPFPQAAFVQCADLFRQHDAVLGKTAAVGPYADMGGQPVFILTAGDGRRNHGRAVAVADLILNNKYRPDASLF